MLFQAAAPLYEKLFFKKFVFGFPFGTILSYCCADRSRYFHKYEIIVIYSLETFLLAL